MEDPDKARTSKAAPPASNEKGFRNLAGLRGLGFRVQRVRVSG